jgi:prophage regulatory protein
MNTTGYTDFSGRLHHSAISPIMLGAAEIAQLLGGLSRQRVSQLTAHKDFPEPLARLQMGSVWRYEDAARWARRNGRILHPLG